MNAIRAKTRDVAFPFRMGAGFAGDVNRTHPATIEPVVTSATVPPTAFGQACLVDTATNTVRAMAAGDTALTTVYGVLVRPYPFQQVSATNYGAAPFGSAGGPGPSALADVLRSGYIMVQIPAAQASVPTKNGAAFVWVAVNSGQHVQGNFEAQATGGSTAALANATFNGPADATGVVELMFNI